jgi:hypothetical protein
MHRPPRAGRDRPGAAQRLPEAPVARRRPAVGETRTVPLRLPSQRTRAFGTYPGTGCKILPEVASARGRCTNAGIRIRSRPLYKCGKLRCEFHQRPAVPDMRRHSRSTAGSGAARALGGPTTRSSVSSAPRSPGSLAGRATGDRATGDERARCDGRHLSSIRHPRGLPRAAS